MQIQQPKKCRNGRYRFEDEIKINNTDALSKFEEDEYPSENLENHIIKAIVERNDKYGVPSTLTLKFKLSQNEIFTTMTVRVLPSVVNAKKDDKEAVSDYVHFQTHEDVQKQTRDLKKADPKAYNAAVAENVASIVDYIKRELCMKYLKFKRSEYPNDHDKAVMKYLENLSILREYDLEKVKPEAIKAKKLVVVSYIEEPNEKEKDFYAIVDFSRKVQTSSKEPLVCFTYVRDNENIIGLKKGKTAEEVEKFAIQDAKSNENKLGIDLVNSEIFDRYVNGRVMQKPQEMQ